MVMISSRRGTSVAVAPDATRGAYHGETPTRNHGRADRAPAPEGVPTARSRSQLRCHLLRPDRGADLEEQPVRVAEFALAGGVVAAEARHLGAFDAKEGLVALRARHLEPGISFGDCGLDFS